MFAASLRKIHASFFRGIGSPSTVCKSAKFVSVRAMASVWRSLCITCVVVCTAVRTDRRATLAAEDTSKHAEAVTLATEVTFAEAVEGPGNSCWYKSEGAKCQAKETDSEGYFVYYWGWCRCQGERYGLAEVGMSHFSLWRHCKNSNYVCK
ncbi:unnamed protein product [Effrenium voratum]|nr:unnamed protein product [Effrenium voratum]